MIHTVTTDKRSQSSKPTGREIGLISNDLKYKIEVTPEKLLEITTQPLGFSWSPALFSDRRSNDNWLAQCVFALDFDDGTPAEAVIGRFKEYGLIPNVLYYTFSSSGAYPKYRLVFFFDRVIKDKDRRDAVQRTLMTIGEECDDACKDASRMYYGGKTGKVISSSSNSLQNAFEWSGLHSNGTSSRQTFTSNTPHPHTLDPKDSTVEKNGTSSSIINRSTNFRSAHSRSGTVEWYEKYKKFKRNKTVKIDKLANKVRILEDFSNHKRFSCDQLYGLASNLYWLKGGPLWMKNKMKKFNEINEGTFDQEGRPLEYTEEEFNIPRNIKRLNKSVETYRKPERLESFSSHKEDHRYRFISDAVRIPEGYTRKLKKDTAQISLNKAEKIRDVEFHRAVHSDDDKVYLLKMPTGIGKTELAVGLRNVLICVPTHALKGELTGRMAANGIAVVTTPKLPSFANPTHNNEIERYYSMGLNSRARKYVENVSEGTGDDAELAQQYLEEMEEAYNTSLSVITTHQRGVFTEFKTKDTIIFDEDPLLNALMETKSFRYSDLVMLLDELNMQEGADETVKHLEQFKSTVYEISEEEFAEVPTFEIDESDASEIKGLFGAIHSSNVESNILEALRSPYVYIDSEKEKKIVRYVIPRPLPDKKIIIMSATVQEKFYEELFPEREIEAVELASKVKLKGEILQYTERSGSRTSIRNSIEEYNDILDGNPTLTFAEFIERFDRAIKKMYFGNLLGHDEYGGVDLNVLGTPHMNPAQYILLALMMGVELEPGEASLNYELIQWGGYEFKFNAYEHPKLRDIQLTLIQSELIQAVGRARLLREDATVKVYSNMPLPNSTIVENW